MSVKSYVSPHVCPACMPAVDKLEKLREENVKPYVAYQSYVVEGADGSAAALQELMAAGVPVRAVVWIKYPDPAPNGEWGGTQRKGMHWEWYLCKTARLAVQLAAMRACI